MNEGPRFVAGDLKGEIRRECFEKADKGIAVNGFSMVEIKSEGSKGLEWVGGLFKRVKSLIIDACTGRGGLRQP